MKRRLNVWCIVAIFATGLGYFYISRHISADDSVPGALYRGLFRLTVGSRDPDFTSVRPSHCTGCFQSEVNLLVSPKSSCTENRASDTLNKNPSVIILVSSYVSHIKSRRAIRNSWGKADSSGASVRVVFILGLGGAEDDITSEANQFQDILQGEFTETYEHLTLKTMVGINWATKTCPTMKFVMKTDDDVWVNVKSLVNTLKYQDLENTLAGHCYYGEYPRRINKESKWFVSPQEYASDTYPNYCAGVGYVMPMSVAKGISNISPNVPYFKMEDVYIGLCAEKLGANVKSISGFYTDKASGNICEMKMNHVITSHPWQPRDLGIISASKFTCSSVFIFLHYYFFIAAGIVVIISFLFAKVVRHFLRGKRSEQSTLSIAKAYLKH